MGMADCWWNHLACSQRPCLKAPHPSVPEASVKSCISELGVQWVSKISEVPDQLGRKFSHQARSRLASRVIGRWWCRCLTDTLRSIKRHRKVRPAGTTLHMNDSLPIGESTWRLVRLHFFDALNDWSSAKIDDLQSADILAVVEVVSMSMPKNVIDAVGFTTFSGLIGALTRMQIWSMVSKFCWRSDYPAGPAVRKSSR